MEKLKPSQKRVAVSLRVLTGNLSVNNKKDYAE